MVASVACMACSARTLDHSRTSVRTRRLKCPQDVHAEHLADHHHHRMMDPRCAARPASYAQPRLTRERACLLRTSADHALHGVPFWLPSPPPPSPSPSSALAAVEAVTVMRTGSQQQVLMHAVAARWKQRRAAASRDLHDPPAGGLPADLHDPSAGGLARQRSLARWHAALGWICHSTPGTVRADYTARLLSLATRPAATRPR